MLYTIPDYYKEFKCTADKCEDTCCAGWQIVVDRKSLSRYRQVKGKFGKRVRKSVDWKEGAFRQDRERRCAFLNEENLCDLYANLGEKSLCRTCRLYPRHIEEFEGVREISLSASCPEVARILLERRTPVKFRTYEKAGEEEYEDFDPFLFSVLLDAREAMLQILQNRELSIEVREGLILGMAHDMQRRVQRRELFECSHVIERYQTDEAAEFTRSVIEKEDRKRTSQQLFSKLYQLELLKEDWGILLVETEDLLYKEGETGYWKKKAAFEAWRKKYLEDWDIHTEQLLVYFIFTYFVGAVYDGEIYAKVRFSISMVHLIQELWMARWLKNEGQLTKEEMVELLYRFSREVEHSDKNLKRAERIMGR